MTDVVTSALTKIYENQDLTVTARIDRSDVESIEEVTFKFLKDGEQFEEKTVPIAEGEQSAGQTTVSHAVKAPAVADDKSCYFLDYHYFYKIKNADGSTESLQNFPASRIQVFPRVAQLKVTDKDGKAFPNFEFMVEQNGVCGEVRKTVASDTPNAKGETIAAGSCEFNLGLFAGFRIVPSPPYQIIEEVVGTGRKREVKGAIGFRAVFVAPQAGNIKQYVNCDVENLGQTGIGHAVTIEVGVHPGDTPFLKAIASPEVHFRVTYGPDAESPVAKSERDDKDHPTKVKKASDADASATIEEKEAKKKYQGKVKLSDGAGKFVVALGKAGGDTCTVEISGSDKFLADKALSPDATLSFENWRRVHYELMVPDVVRDQLDASSSSFNAEAARLLDELGRKIFVEFVRDKTHVFNAAAHADYGTLAPKRFLGMKGDPEGVAYVLSGRNWRKLPEKQSWTEAHPGKTLYIAFCDRLLKWRQGTKDKKAGTKDFSGTLKEAAGKINAEEKFEGVFMPFSGNDAGEGVADIHWTADISKDDAVCKYKPVLTIKEDRYDGALATGLGVALDPDAALPAQPERVLFKRLPYPDLELVDKTEFAGKEQEDDGKVVLKEPALGKELTLKFEVPAAAEQDDAKSASEDAKDDGSEAGDGEDDADDSKGTFSDLGPSPRNDDDLGIVEEKTAVTSDHEDQIDAFFKKLFKDGKELLGASEDANKFTVEIHGGTGADHRARRIAEVRRAVEDAYTRTHGHDHYDFKKDLAAADTARIQGFVDGLLADRAALGAVKAKVVVCLGCPKDAKHGVDDCFNAVKDKLKELFDASAKEFASHPGLDPAKEFAPREGDCALAEVTDVNKSSVKEWHFKLPAVLADGRPGPGAFVGAEKTADKCPVKFELSFQPHEASPGEADGKLLAWACGEPNAAKQLISLVLRGFQGSEDKACLAHGHGEEGVPGQCLIDDGELCAKCIAHGRSKNLTVV